MGQLACIVCGLGAGSWVGVLAHCSGFQGQASVDNGCLFNVSGCGGVGSRKGSTSARCQAEARGSGGLDRGVGRGRDSRYR